MAKQVVLATGNAAKVRELAGRLQGFGLDVLPQSQFAVPEVEETGLTFVENALIKARAAALASGLPAIADDSGLRVDALQGAPGVRSARYAGDQVSDEDNWRKLLLEMATVPDSRRSAMFCCVLVYLRFPEDPLPLIVQGAWRGCIVRESNGDGGFGYDPVFFIPECGCTAAQLSPDMKSRLSHRGKALDRLVAGLSDLLSD